MTQLSPDASSKVIKNKKTNKYELVCLDTGEVLQEDIFNADLSNYRYDKVMGDFICNLIRQGKTMKQIGERTDTPTLSVIQYWRRTFPLFDEEIIWARKARAEYYHDKVVEIADNVMEKDEIPVAKYKTDVLNGQRRKAIPVPLAIRSSTQEKLRDRRR